LLSIPNISESRDPLFFGRMSFPDISISLANQDGNFDTWGRDVDIYGNDCRVFIGFEDVDYTTWKRIYTGFMRDITVSEEEATIGVSDKRRQLTKAITYTCTDTNALTAIEEILADNYSYTYDSTFFDTTSWEAARGNVETVTINMQTPEPAIDVIEYIAASVFGLFRVDENNLFTFRVVDTSDSIVDVIQALDILGPHTISYDPTEVISSVRVGYARDWTDDTYTYYTDSSQESTVYAAYKTYNEREFLTALPGLTAATSFATKVVNRASTVHGTETITVPLEYNAMEIGDQIGVVTQRGAQSMLGERKAEIISTEYALEVPLIRLGIRHGGTVESILTDEASVILTTEADALIMVE